MFLETLRDIDDGRRFMTEHASYKESAPYLLKYNQLETTALEQIKFFFSETWEKMFSKSTALLNGVYFLDNISIINP